MATLRTGQITDFSNQGTEFTVDSVDTDGAQIKETWYIPDFKKWHGYYRQIPELRSVINKFASWTFGRGIKADDKNKKKLDKIRGIGRESPRSVLKNCWRTAMICGDSFAHKIRDEQGRLTNLKPLNSGHIAIVANAQGIIVAYEQKTSVVGETIRYDIDEIYHLSYERIADEIHGIPFPEALETLIVSRNEGIADLRVLYHRTVKPILVWEAETDDTAKLNSLEATVNDAFKKTESMIIPAGVIREIKRASSPQFSTGEINSLAYIKFLVRLFVTSVGMPEVVMGWGEQTTEASANIIYLAYQQEIEDMQLYNQEAAEIQLNITFDLEFPASIETMLQNDQKKDGPVKAEKPQAGKDT
jgi:hypothetical protein